MVRVCPYSAVWRSGDLMVNALVHRSSGPVSNPGLVYCCVLGQDTLLLKCFISTQEYKWAPATLHTAGAREI